MAAARREARIPGNWNRWWLLMWLVSAPTLVVSAFYLRFWIWVAATVVGFLAPELVSLVKKDDSLPPLTHTIRHFLPDWLAFPLIYFSLGGVGANWLGFPRPARIGALMGLLGWLSDHFTVTYAQPDPFPFSNRAKKAGTEKLRLPT